MKAFTDSIKYIFTLLGLIFAAVFYLKRKPESQVVKVDDKKVNEEIKKSEEKIESIQKEIDNLKVEDKSLESELDYWNKEKK